MHTLAPDGIRADCATDTAPADLARFAEESARTSTSLEVVPDFANGQYILIARNPYLHITPVRTPLPFQLAELLGAQCIMWRHSAMQQQAQQQAAHDHAQTDAASDVSGEPVGKSVGTAAEPAPVQRDAAPAAGRPSLVVVPR